MPRCTFCKKRYEAPRGLTIFLNDGRQLNFCSGKCRKNSEMGRDNKRVRWVKKFEFAGADEGIESEEKAETRAEPEKTEAKKPEKSSAK